MKPIDEAGSQIAIEHLQATLGRNDAGEVTLGWDASFDNSVAAVARRAQLAPSIPEEDIFSIARSSVLDSYREGRLSLADVRKRMRAGESKYLAQPEQPFVFVSSISIRYDKALTPIVLDGSRIAFHFGVPRKFAAPEALPYDSNRVGQRLPFTYAAVTISVRARSVHSAAQLAFDRFDLLRAIWNFWYNYRRWRHGGHAERAYNDMVAGPIHTIHYPDGSPAGPQYWFDPSFKERANTKTITKDYEKLRAYEKRVRRTVRISPLGPLLKTLYLRYGRALEERSAATALLRLWGALEDATVTAENSRYDVTIRRAAAVWPDPEYRKVVLNDLRSWRNSIVHEGSEPRRAHEAVEELRQYVERIILLLLAFPKRFTGVQRLSEFLDLPPDQVELRRRAKLHDWAAKYRGEL